MLSLGTLSGGTYSVATGINNRGQVSGYAQHSLLFEKGEVIDLGTVPGGTFEAALGINNRSELVGRVIMPSGTFAATCTSKHREDTARGTPVACRADANIEAGDGTLDSLTLFIRQNTTWPS